MARPEKMVMKIFWLLMATIKARPPARVLEKETVKSPPAFVYIIAGAMSAERAEPGI